MKRETFKGYAMVLAGIAGMVVLLFGFSALGAEQPMEKPIGPAMESGKDFSDQGLSLQRIDPKTGELTKEMERPMRVPDSSREFKELGYRPLCGAGNAAVKHYACGEGYDFLAF